MLRVGSRLLLGACCGCGPKSAGSEGTTGQATTSGTTDDSATTDTSEGSEGSDTNGWPNDVGTPDAPCTEYAEIRAIEDTPYRLCMRGLAEVTAHWFATGEVAHRAYAQFFQVYAESQTRWDRVIHDVHEGLEDCGAVTNGNSGFGDAEKLLFQDAGDVMFLGPDYQVMASQSGDPISVIGYDVDLTGIPPQWGQRYGFVAAGATTPPYDLSDAVYLPDPIVVTDPALVATTSVDHDALVLQWEPSDLAIPTWLFLHFQVDGSHTLTIHCEMVDDGEFQIPPALLELAALPATANVYLSRTDRNVVMLDEFQGIRVEGRTSLEGKLTVQ